MNYKYKFVVNPQQDSEGFTDYAAKCVGCGADEPCPRSGHCERYDSPLRLVTNMGIVDVEERNLNYADPRLSYDYGQMQRAVDFRINDMLLMDTSNRISEEQLAAYTAEIEEIQGKKAVAAALLNSAITWQPNPKGWQEVDGVKLPAINWAERSDEELEEAFQEWYARHPMATSSNRRPRR